MKVLRVLYEGGHEELLLVDDITASWEGWESLDYDQKKPLYVTHQGGVSHINLRKVLTVEILCKKIILTSRTHHIPDENPLNEDSHYDDCLN